MACCLLRHLLKQRNLPFGPFQLFFLTAVFHLVLRSWHVSWWNNYRAHCRITVTTRWQSSGTKTNSLPPVATAARGDEFRLVICSLAPSGVSGWELQRPPAKSKRADCASKHWADEVRENVCPYNAREKAVGWFIYNISSHCIHSAWKINVDHRKCRVNSE